MKKCCVQCHKDYIKPYTMSKSKWATSKYCSKQCRLDSYPKKVELNCKQCANKFVVKNGRSERSKFCSKSCQLAHYPSKATIVCWECKGHFIVRNFRKESAHFCSQQCASQYRDEGKRTADKKIRQSWAYKAWRTLVFERDDYKCTECETRGGSLHADHIKPFALYPELRFDVSNGRTLCVPCHMKTNTWGRGAVYRKKMALGSTV